MLKRNIQVIIILLFLTFLIVFAESNKINVDIVEESVKVLSKTSTEEELQVVETEETTPTANYADCEFLLGNSIYKTWIKLKQFEDAGFNPVEYLDSNGRAMLPVKDVDVSAIGEVDITTVTPTGEVVILELNNIEEKAITASECYVTSITIPKDAIGLSLCGVTVGDSIENIPEYQLMPQYCNDRHYTYDISGKCDALLRVNFEDGIITGVTFTDCRLRPSE